MRLFVYISCFTGVFGLVLQPSPTANIQRFKSLVLNCSLEKSWTTVAFNLENLNIALFFNKRIEACSNYAEPTPELYQTYCDYNSKTFYLTINNVTDTYNGKYIECMYTFESEVGRVRTILNVQYPPDSTPSLTQIPNGPIIEGNTVRLICNISGGNPLASIVWQCIGFTYVSQTGNNYAVSVIERVVTKDDNGKECRCIIKHPLLDPDKEVRSTLNVYFGPKSISLSPAIYLYVVSEDNDINIPICTAICSPDCNYTWTGPNGFREHYYSLQLNSVNRTQSGLYMCQAKNDYGSKTSDSINIIVSYAPTILRLQTSNGNMVDEHQSVTFQCEVDSYPASDITWIHSTTGTLLNKVEKVLKSNFTILKTECLQSGTYRCEASNGIGDMSKTVYAKIDLFVLCSARMDHRRMEAPGIVAIMENDDWNITVYLIAYPEPMISWTRRNSETEIISIMNVYNSFGISEHSSTLSIRKISKSDYGFYTMNASNSILGLQYIKSFEVIPQDPPDQPTDMLVACEITSMIVLWRSGFNGGSQQKFRVAWLNIRTQNTKYSSEIMDSGQGITKQHIIQSLEPSTSYIIYVEATNKHGIVRSENNANCTTRSSLSQSNNTVAISVGASIGSSILILIIAVLVVLFLRKRPCNKEENSQLYQSTYPDTSRQKTTFDQHTYDELQTIKTGSNPEYEEANSVSTYEEIGIANLESYYQNANKDNKESIQRHETSTVYANTKT